MTDTFAAVERILRSLCGEVRDLGPETNLVTDLELDSILQLDLVVQLENQFEIELELEEDQEVVTIANLVAWVDCAREEVGTRK